MLQTDSPVTVTIALAFWLAGCVAAGNLLSGLRSYACLLAGCTCAIIAVRTFQNPPHLHELAFGRIAGTIIGIIVATTVTLLFTPRQSSHAEEYLKRVRRTAGETIAWLALLLRRDREDILIRHEGEILLEIAELEHLLDAAGAGSLRFKKKKRQIRNLLASLLSLLAAGRLTRERLARHGTAWASGNG